MKTLVVEDEALAARDILNVLNEIGNIQVLAVLDSIASTVEWFGENPQPELVFMDIHLADGSAFKIFDLINIACPIIFTTAYDEYAIKAFKVNSIDYLLKPIAFNELEAALNKFGEQHSAAPVTTQVSIEMLNKVKEMLRKQYKTRFVIKVGEHLKSIPVEDILFFYSLEKATYFCTSDYKTYLVDYSLDRISEMVDEQRFFRINRKYILSNQSIADIVFYSNSRLKIKLKKPDEEPIIVSRDKVQAFKEWLDL